MKLDDVIKHKNKEYKRLRPRVQLICKDPSLTQQEFKEECDLAETVRRIKRRGEDLPTIPEEFYRDTTQELSYAEMRQQVAVANATFSELPSHIREKFNNSTENFLNRLSDEQSHEELRGMGFNMPLVENKTKEVPDSTEETSKSTVVETEKPDA